MKKAVSAFMAAFLLTSSVLSQEVIAFEFPDLSQMAPEAASEIIDAAGKAGSALSEAAGQAGKVVSDAAEKAGSVLSDWGAQAGKTADEVKEKLTDAGVTMDISPEQLGSATVQKASELTEQAGKGAEDAIGAVSEAADYAVDQAGHVIDLAAMGVDYVSSEAMEALQVLQEYGSNLMKIAEDAVADIDLSKPESWETAKVVVDNAVEKAFETGMIGREIIQEKTVKLVTRIVFGALMYGYQYQNGQITLGEYVSSMSEVLIREGVPAGVAYLVKLLPISIPFAESLATEAAYYLISIAYEDKPGNEIEKEEEGLLDAAIETETEQ